MTKNIKTDDVTETETAPNPDMETATASETATETATETDEDEGNKPAVPTGDFKNQNSLFYAMATVAKRKGKASEVVEIMASKGIEVNVALVNSRWKALQKKFVAAGRKLPSLKVGKRGRVKLDVNKVAADIGDFFDVEEAPEEDS
jgi:hypothetical protein